VVLAFFSLCGFAIAVWAMVGVVAHLIEGRFLSPFYFALILGLFVGLEARSRSVRRRQRRWPNKRATSVTAREVPRDVE
jgi:pilus assembly protein TadC